MKQIDVFKPYVPRGTRATSHAAAKTFTPRASSFCTRVYERIRECGLSGATDAELIAAFPNKSPNSIRPRRIDLMRQGRIRNSGRVRNGGIVWIA